MNDNIYIAILELKNYFFKKDYKYIKLDTDVYLFYNKKNKIIVKIAFCFIKKELNLKNTLYDLFNDDFPKVDEKQLWIYEERWKKFQKYTIKGSDNAIKLIKDYNGV